MSVQLQPRIPRPETSLEARLADQYLKRILRARVYEVAVETPLAPAPLLSERIGNKVYLKREDLQPVYSFKLRGAYNRLVQLSPEERARGVITASAGNHAQGVALGARRLGIKAVIVMPRTTPEIKVQAVRSLGARAELHGNSYNDALEHTEKLIAQHGMTFVPPYDHPDVIAGQGTVAKEILQQHPDALHGIFVPVGGGGLVAGIAAFAKAVRPEIRVIGVEPADAASLKTALATGERLALDQVGLFVDGCAVKQAGEETFRVARALVDEVVTAEVDQVCAAMEDIFKDTRALAEPAGALALAGLKRYVAERGIEGENLVAVQSGANVNFDRLRHVAERTALGEHHEALLAVTIPERPGSFRGFCELLSANRSITEFNYRYADADQAHIFVGVRLQKGESEKDELVAQLRENGYPVLDMSRNEMAKVHVRHMVGGRADVDDEILFRFEFPERPGALLRFLNRIGQQWNISLFHYRNHGAAYGRVLAGMQVPEGERGQCLRLLDEIGYAYEEETDNPVYDFFLGSG
jgi:threonine dehydratase